jgi:hypothetical protein
MEDIQTAKSKDNLKSPAHPFLGSSKTGKLLTLIVVIAVVGGIGSGYTLANQGSSSTSLSVPGLTQQAKTADQDNRTFKDFAEGVIQPRPSPKNSSEYVEGTHLLQRDGTTPVALTSSVVDLSQYEGKKVKVFGETQKALKEGWLMDVGKVEEL